MTGGLDAIGGALAPIVLLIALGHQLRSRQVVADGFWLPLERLTFHVFFPALLLSSLAKARLDGVPLGGMALTEMGGTLAMAAMAAALSGLAAKPPLRLDGPGFSSLFQCVIRPNTYVGLAAAAGLWGARGLTLTAVCVALVVPMVNLLSVLALLHWAGGGGRFRWRAALLPVAGNPLIVSCLIGIALNVSGIGSPPVIGPFLDILGSASLPLGLLAIGAGLDLGGLKRAKAPVLLAVVVKLAGMPALVWGIGRLIGLEGMPLAVCVLYAGLPASPAGYVMARQMGGDAPLAAGILSLQVLTAMVTMPILVLLLAG